MPIVASLSNVVPRPLAVLVVHLLEDDLSGELEHRATRVGVHGLLGGPLALVLGLPHVEVVHVDHRDGVPVLVVVEDEAEVLEVHLDVDVGRVLVDLLVHYDACLAGDGSQEVLMVRRSIAVRDLMDPE